MTSLKGRFLSKSSRRRINKSKRQSFGQIFQKAVEHVPQELNEAKTIAQTRQAITILKLLGPSVREHSHKAEKVAKKVLLHNLPPKTSIMATSFAIVFGVMSLVSVFNNWGSASLKHTVLSFEQNKQVASKMAINFHPVGLLENAFGSFEKQTVGNINKLAGAIGEMKVLKQQYNFIVSYNDNTAPSQDVVTSKLEGKVLAANTVKKTVVASPVKKVVATKTVQQQIEATLNNYLAQGKFKGPKGDPGTSANLQNNSNGNNSLVVGGNAIISYIQPVASNNFVGSSISGFNQLSAGTLSVQNGTINNSFTILGNLISSGTTALGTTTVSGTLTAASFVGDGSQLTGITSGGTSQWTTVTSTPNIFFNSGNVGIGTSTGSATLSVVGSGGNIISAFKQDGTNVFGINLVGTMFSAGGLANINTSNNAYVRPDTTGTTISRNIADSNPTLIVSQSNSGSTGDILQLKNNTGTLFTVTQSGNVGIGRTPTQNFEVNGNAVIGMAITGTNYSTTTLSVVNSQSSVVRTQLNIMNIGNTPNTGTGIDFYTYTNTGNTTSEARIGTIDDGNFSNHITFSTKVPGNGGNNSLAERMRITSSGNLGINTSTPLYTFSLQGASGTDLFDLSSSTGSSILHVTQTGNVGIGTATPTSLLQLGNVGTNGFSASDKVLMIGNSSGHSVLQMGQDSFHSLFSYWSYNATPANAFAVIGTYGYSNNLKIDAQNILFQTQASGNVGIGSATPGSLLSVQAASGTTIPIFTVASSNNASLLTVLANGNIGIGTGNPTAPLEVVGDIVSKGTSWSLRTLPVGVNTLNAITYGNGLFVAVAQGGAATNTIVTSPDGVNWTARTTPSAQSLKGVIYGNGLFVAVGQNSTYFTSPDGINWTARTQPGSILYAITYGNGLFVTAGGSTIISYSPDGINWTNVSLLSNIYSIAYGNGLFVAVGQSGTIYTSSDGSNWASRSTGTNNWKSVTFGNGLFVAVGDNSNNANSVVTSPDGINWTIRSSAGSSSWKSVTYGNGLFVAVESSNSTTTNIMTSPDGINWVNRNTPNTNALYGVTYGNGTFVAVGLGVVISSGKAEINSANTNNIYQGGMSIQGNVAIGTTSTTSITSALIIQNTAGTNDAFRIASSSGTTLAVFDYQGHLQIGTTTDTAMISVQGSSGSVLPLLNLSSSSGASLLNVGYSGLFGLGTTTGTSNFTLQGSSGQSNSLMNIASSSGSSLFNITASGNVGIGTTSPNSLLHIALDASSTSNSALYTANTGSGALLQIGSKPLVSANANGTYIGINAPSSFTGYAFDYQYGGTRLLNITYNGVLNVGTNAVNQNGFITGSATLGLAGTNGSSNGTYLEQLGYGYGTVNTTNTSGVGGGTKVWHGFVPTSGTAVFNDMAFITTFLQTGNANGISRSLLINPTLSSVYDYRSLEISATTTNVDASTTPATTVYNVLFNPLTYNNTSSTVVNLKNASTLSLANPLLGNQITLASSTALSITSSALGASTTNAYGLYLQAPTGAVNNYAAIFNGGNVGIGTSSPVQALSVAGNLRLTGALFDTNNASGTTGMLLQSTGLGQQWVATSTLGLGVTGGINGYISRWTSASALSTGTILDNGTVAGIIATSSSVNFNIQGTGVLDPFNVSSSSTNSLFRVTALGNVGINASAPVAKLQINNPSSALANNHGNIFLSENGVNGPEAANGIEFQTSNTSFGYGSKIYTNSSAGSGAGFLGFASRYNSSSWTENMIIDQQYGTVQIGTTTLQSSNYKLAVASGQFYNIYGVSSNAGGYTAYFTNTGSGNGCNLAGGATTWSCSSDRNLKTNIETITGPVALDKLSQINGVTFNWKKSSTTPQQIGLIAQDVQAVFPQAVSTTTEGTLSLQYESLMGPVISGVNELHKQLTELQQTVADINNISATSTIIYGQVYLSVDSVGQGKILTGQTLVTINFKKPYQYRPIITLTPEEFVIGAYRVTNVTVNGFEIEVNQIQIEDVTFNWHAFASADAQLTVSDGSTQNIPLVVINNSQPVISNSNSTPPPVATPADSTSTPPQAPDATSTPADQPPVTSQDSNPPSQAPDNSQTSSTAN